MDQQQQQQHSGASSGFLRTKISLKGNQSQLSLVSPFYGMKPELPPQSALLGSDDLISMCDLSGAYNRYCGPTKKPREELSAFLPHVCGAAHINKKADSQCSLRKLIEDPPIMGREINNLSASQMVGFKLTPGPIPDGNRFFDLADPSVEQQRPINSNGLPYLVMPSSSSTAAMASESADGRPQRQRRHVKRSLDDLTLEDDDRKVKRPKGSALVEESGGGSGGGSVQKEKKKRKKEKKRKKDKEKGGEGRERDRERQRAEFPQQPPVVTPFF